MAEEAEDGKPSFAETIGRSVTRKLRARRDARHPVWQGLGLMGMVGWTVVVPTLIGVFTGLWLDSEQPGSRSWTLTMLAAGLALGCVNAWRWVAKENAFNKDHKDGEHGGDGK